MKILLLYHDIMILYGEYANVSALERMLEKSGVKFIAQPGGSVRDDAVIETCNKYGMVMAFTGIRLFHH